MIALALLLAASSAHAQPERPPDHTPAPPPPPNHAWLETAIFAGGGTEETDFGTAEGNYVTMTLLGALDYHTSEHVRFELRWPVVLSHAEVIETSGPTESRASGSGTALGNAFLGFFRIGGTPAGHTHVGGGVALPFASLPGDADDELDPDQYAAATSLNLAAQMRGSADAWLFSPERLALVFRGGYEHRSSYVAAIDGAVAAFIPRSDDASFESLVQAGVRFAGVSPDRRVELGARAQVVWVPSAGGDNAQLAMALYGRLALDRAFLLADLLVNLDEPSGFAFADGGVWALTLGGGVSW